MGTQEIRLGASSIGPALANVIQVKMGLRTQRNGPRETRSVRTPWSTIDDYVEEIVRLIVSYLTACKAGGPAVCFCDRRISTPHSNRAATTA